MKRAPIILAACILSSVIYCFASAQDDVSANAEQPSPTAADQQSSVNASEQAAPSEEKASSEAPKDESPAAPVQEKVRKTVTAIEVRGGKSISSNTILSRMKTKVGAEYLDNVMSDDIKRLYLLGFFDTINIETEDYKDGLKVIINVKERPVIEKITFAGIRRLNMKDEKLKESLKSKESQYLDYPKLTEDVEILRKMYEKLGFSEVTIDYQADVNKETNKVKVQFNVVEGKRIYIKDIIVQGNNSFPAGKILRLLKTKRAWLFNAGALKEEVLKEDIERITAFYRRQGFADATAEYSVRSEQKKPFLYIRITITEGKRYYVGTVAIQGNNDISEKELLAALKESIPGKIYSQEALSQDVGSVQGFYFDRGYISATVDDTTSLNPATGRIDVVYHVVENQITYVDKIKIKGNIKTKDLVIRRELRIKPGERFDGDKLRRTKERLQNLGFFEEVSYDSEETQSPTKKDLVVDVKEAKTGSFSFGGGYSTVDKLVGFVEIEQKNFDWKNFPYFTGAGQNLKLRGSFGSVTNGLDLSFTEPWLFDYPISFGFDAYKHEHKRATDVGYGYDEGVTGADLRLGKELTEYLRGDITYRYDSIKITNIDDNSSADLKNEEGTNNISSMNFSLTFDTRNNVFDPVKGNLAVNSLEVAGGPFGGDKDYWKYYARLSQYIPLLRGSALEFRGRIGMEKPYGDSQRIPIYGRFFAGGADTIRGYDERRVGPVDSVTKDPLGGQSMLIGNVEYTYPLMSFIKLAAFYDIGNVWAKLGDLASGGYMSGFGLGVRLKTPVGPIMLDYGIPLNKEPGEDRKKSGRLHFSMSNSF